MKTTCRVKSCNTLPEHQIDRHAVTLVQLKEQLMRDGYYATAHALEGAIKAVGWEIAGKLKKAKKK